jgi:hypothetical protein
MIIIPDKIQQKFHALSPLPTVLCLHLAWLAMIVFAVLGMTQINHQTHN